MRILSVGNFYNPSWDGSEPDEEHIAKALESLGHEVCRFQREKIDEGLMLPSDIRGEWADFVLLAQWDGYPEWTVKQLREQYKCPIVFWSFDFQEWGQPWCERLIEQSDLYLSKRLADSKYPNWRWLPADFAPQFMDKWPGDVEQDIDVLFTGSYLPWATERIETLKAVDEKFNLHIYSVTPDQWKAAGFKNVFGPQMDDALPRLIARAKINLSIDHTIEAGYFSDRVAQIICCGGFVLHRHQPMSEIVFRSNIVYFYDKEHCLEQIEWWLEHGEDREVIAAEAYDNSVYYKVKERVADMLTIVREVL